MKRRHNAEQPARGIFNDGPESVTSAVVHGKIAHSSRGRTADVTHDRGIHLHGAAAQEPDAKREVDVLEVAKEVSSNPPARTNHSIRYIAAARMG